MNEGFLHAFPHEETEDIDGDQRDDGSRSEDTKAGAVSVTEVGGVSWTVRMSGEGPRMTGVTRHSFQKDMKLGCAAVTVPGTAIGQMTRQWMTARPVVGILSFLRE